MKDALKYLIFQAAGIFGINATFRWYLRNRLLVLCYHGVVSRSPPEDGFLYRNAVSTQEFEKQLKTLVHLFHPISVNDLIKHAKDSTSPPGRSVLITFDDGFRNNSENAAPILKRLGIPAAFFVTTGYIGSDRILWTQEVVEIILGWSSEEIPLPGIESTVKVPGDKTGRIALSETIRKRCKTLSDEERSKYVNELRNCVPDLNLAPRKELYTFMTWDDVRSLGKQGFEIGSHTVEHPILTKLSADRLKQELISSKRKIEEEVGLPCRVITYPNGGHSDYSQEVITQTEDAGYDLAFTLTEETNPGTLNRYAISRVNVVSGVPHAVFHTRISGLYSFLASQSRG